MPPSTSESDDLQEAMPVVDDNIANHPHQVEQQAGQAPDESVPTSNHNEDDSSNSLWETMEGVEMLNDSSSDDEFDEEDTSAELRAMMHRIRCLFGALTFPIPPLAAAVALTMFYFLGIAYVPFQIKAMRALWNGMPAADFPDLPTCSHPLYPFSAVTVVAFVYTTRHDLVRRTFFTSDRGRRFYDKFVQGMALLYVYMGILLKQTCQDDVPPGQLVDSCVATCPHVTAAFSLYVLALECFSVAIFIPLLMLPCVYVWVARRRTHRQSTRPRGTNHRRMQSVFNGLSAIQVVANTSDSTTTTPPLMAILGGNNERIPLHNKECCICMADLTDANVVRVKNCGHVFHKACLSHWVRRRRTTCPLCRADIRNYGTFGLGYVEP